MTNTNQPSPQPSKDAPAPSPAFTPPPPPVSHASGNQHGGQDARRTGGTPNRRRRGQRRRGNQQRGNQQQQGGGGAQQNYSREEQLADDRDAALHEGSHQGGQGLSAHHGHSHPQVELPQAFAALGLEPALLYALADIHFTKPSEIQEKLIPIALTGKDVLGQARTGTGKTAAFGLPILQKLDLSQPFQAIVIVPTRELAVQVEAELVRFSRHKPVRFALCYGGNKISGQMKLLHRHPHVIVGTPGRIIDLWERGALVLRDMRFVVCDEVDRMFDIGFRDDIRKILAACEAPRQTIFVSATISDEIERMVHKHMQTPERVFTSDPKEELTNPEAVQYYVGVNPWDKQRALRMVMRQVITQVDMFFFLSNGRL
jgi:hypothetical protein